MYQRTTPSTPYCDCGLLVKQGTTTKGEHVGRKYWSCSKSWSDQSRCKFFRWSDSTTSTSSSIIDFNHSVNRPLPLSSSSQSNNSKLLDDFDRNMDQTLDKMMNKSFPSSSNHQPTITTPSSSTNNVSNSQKSSSTKLTLSQLCSQFVDWKLDGDEIDFPPSTTKTKQPSSQPSQPTNGPHAIDNNNVLSSLSLDPSNNNSSVSLSKDSTTQQTKPITLLEEQLRRELNRKQLEAVCLDEHDCVCVKSGPGSGKTKIITYRIAYLVLVKGIQPKNIFAMTFTNKAAQEMKTRLFHLIKTFDLQKRIKVKEFNHIGTFHAICATILRCEMNHLTLQFGLDQKFLIFDSDEQESIIKNLYKTSNNRTIREYLPLDMNEDEMIKKLAPSTVIQTISRCKNQEITALDYSKSGLFDPEQVVIAHLFHEYQEYLRKSNGLDFDDLLLYVLHLFNNFPTVREKYSNQCAALLVDEFQDINKLQYKIALHLNEKKKNIFIVGDSDQNIYTFRFSDSSITSDVIKGYESIGKQMKIIVMNQNYRSTANIVKFSDKIIGENTNRLRTDNLTTSNTDGIPVSIISTPKEEQYIKNEILRLIQMDSNIQYGDFAILIRVNSASRPFEEVFSAHKIPYKILNSTRFYDSMEIKDMLGYCKAIANPDNDHFLLNCIKIPNRRISVSTETNLIELTEHYKKSIRMVLKNHEGEIRGYISTNELKSLKSIIQFIEESSAHCNSPSTIVKNIIEFTDYKSYLKSTQKNMFETRRENLNELISVCQEFESKSSTPSLDTFLQSISISTEIDPIIKDSNNAVTISTIHAAKGLEFGIVFVTGVEKGNIPYYKAKTLNEIEEERRLLFVACTRAQSLLCLTSATTRFKFGRNTTCERSDFLGPIMKSSSSCFTTRELSNVMNDHSQIQTRKETIGHLIACRDTKNQHVTASQNIERVIIDSELLEKMDNTYEKKTLTQ